MLELLCFYEVIKFESTTFFFDFFYTIFPIIFTNFWKDLKCSRFILSAIRFELFSYSFCKMVPILTRLYEHWPLINPFKDCICSTPDSKLRVIALSTCVYFVVKNYVHKNIILQNMVAVHLNVCEWLCLFF